MRIINFGQVRGNYTTASARADYPAALIRPIISMPVLDTYFTYYNVPAQIVVNDHLTEPTINTTEFGWVALQDNQTTITNAVFMGMPFPVPCTLVASF